MAAGPGALMGSELQGHDVYEKVGLLSVLSTNYELCYERKLMLKLSYNVVPADQGSQQREFRNGCFGSR